jgi:hypothetical protein
MLTLPALALQHITKKGIIMDKQLEKNLKKIEDHEIAWQLNRVANALEEILRLVKQDQEENKKRWEDKPDEKN